MSMLQGHTQMRHRETGILELVNGCLHAGIEAAITHIAA